MDELSLIIVLVGVPATLGAIADRLMLNRTKGQLHHRLLAVWVWLDEKDVSGLVNWSARLGVRAIESVIHPHSRVLGKLLGGFWISSIFTITVMISAPTLEFIGGQLEALLAAFALGAAILIAARKAKPSSARSSGCGCLVFAMGVVLLLPISGLVAICLVNFPFDAATIYFTHFCLRKAEQAERSRWQAFWLAIDLTIAFLCSFLCLVAFHSLDVLLGSSILSSAETGLMVTPFVLISGAVENLMIFALATTTLFPTAGYLSILLLLIPGKPALSIGKTYAKYFLERATEVKDSKELIVFTLLGLHFSAVAVVASAIYKIVKIGAG